MPAFGLSSEEITLVITFSVYMNSPRSTVNSETTSLAGSDFSRWVFGTNLHDPSWTQLTALMCRDPGILP